jgi:hypothetical protein
MTISIDVLDEPELEFGNGTSGVEPRQCMSSAGAYTRFEGRTPTIELGLVCLDTEVAAVRAWINAMNRPQLGEEGNAQRFRHYPGSDVAFNCNFSVGDRFIRTIEGNRYAQESHRNPVERFNRMLDLFSSRIESMFGDVRPQAVLVALPEELAELRIINPNLDTKDREALQALQRKDERQTELFAPNPDELKRIEELRPQAEELLFRSFYRALKARCMLRPNAVPLQVIRQHTYREDVAEQSPAIRAWHLGVSLFYKAGNIPWRPSNLPDNHCFVGISFHHLKRRGGDIIYSSVAQAFSNTTEPFALKGEPIPANQVHNRQPYLTARQATEMLRRIVHTYEAHTGTKPDRIVLHKTSRYHEEEIEGFGGDGLVPGGLELVWLAQTGFRLIKRGSEAVWRGTLANVGDRDHYLFTVGFVPWWREYPGPHIPSPLQFGSHSGGDIRTRAREILLLTKMNWNSSDGVGRFPITISFARRVGMLMTEMPDDATPNPSYRFYM